MKIKPYIIFLLAVFSCNNKITKVESPLVTVIKLNDAESLADFDEAKKYIDVERVYAHNSDSLSAKQAWIDKVTFFYNIAKDKKFTNVFKYFNYNINEEQNGNNAKVTFKSVDPEVNISKIVYKLELLDKNWKVISIEYINK